MKKFLAAAVVSTVCASPAAAALSSPYPIDRLSFDSTTLLGTPPILERQWRVKDDKGKGNKGHGGNGKSAKAKGDKGKGASKGDNRKAAKDARQGGKAKGHDKGGDKKNDIAAARPKGKSAGKDKNRGFDRQAADLVARDLLTVRAPRSRDMETLLKAAPLLLLGPDILFSDVPHDRLLTYRNCPPGLAKKDPPCVPPGLAKEGVSYDDWTRYSDDDYDRLWRTRRDLLLDRDDVDGLDRLLLSSAQIRDLYGLGNAPAGQRYALIDGLPVLLDDADYNSLLRINDLARTDGIARDLRIAPTAALGQSELIRTYRLPELADGYNYAVLNGQVVTLADSAYDTLQLIRIARAVF